MTSSPFLIFFILTNFTREMLYRKYCEAVCIVQRKSDVGQWSIPLQLRMSTITVHYKHTTLYLTLRMDKRVLC